MSGREHQEVSEWERQYEDGSDPRLLDVIDIPLLRHSPGTYQRENWLIDPDYYWNKIGEIEWSDLADFSTGSADLWINGDSTYNGLNDTIPQAAADTLTCSLQLVHVPQLTLRVFAPGSAFGNAKRRVQAVFSHNDVDYRLWVTDPVYERRYLDLPNGTHQIGECYLTISLGEPYKNACNKLVAAVIEP